MTINEALHAMEEARSQAEESRQDWKRAREHDEMVQEATIQVAGLPLKPGQRWLDWVFVQAALIYAETANRAAEATEAYEAMVLAELAKEVAG